MTRNNGRAIAFIHARMVLTNADVGRPLGLGRFSRKPSAGLYQLIKLPVHTITRGEKRHSRHDCSLRDIHCGRDSNTDVTNGRVVLLILNAAPT